MISGEPSITNALSAFRPSTAANHSSASGGHSQGAAARVRRRVSNISASVGGPISQASQPATASSDCASLERSITSASEPAYQPSRPSASRPQDQRHISPSAGSSGQA